VDVETNTDEGVARIAAAIGEPARARMLYCLLDGHARTSTELAAAADVSASTASVHLSRLKSAELVQVLPRGKHRFYSLSGADVARALESLSIVAGATRARFVPSTPHGLRAARTCYDHLAGRVGVLLHDALTAKGWLSRSYDITAEGAKRLEALGVDVEATRALRRSFAYACLDWSERRPHVGGALAAALLEHALKRKWLVRELDSRALGVTGYGRREFLARFGVRIPPE
jgi:DNA-binding transcriptional ArsR family regulator